MLVIDIETMPNPLMMDKLPQVEADPRLKDPEKIKANIEEKKKEQVEKMALSPLYGQIACIGFYGETHKEVLIDKEEKMIDELFKRIDKQVLFTWNGKGFDFDFIIKRGAILQVCSLMRLKAYTDKYKAENHIDLMEIWAGPNKYAKLDDVAYAVLGRKKIDFDVTQISELMKSKQGQKKIKEYCLEDCKLVYDLARHLGY